MIECPNCKQVVEFPSQHKVFNHESRKVEFLCSPKAERSEVLQGCLPSANCSARPSAVAPNDSLISSVVPREKAEPPGMVALAACPFCGDTNGELGDSAVPKINNRGFKVAVFCNTCFCEGPTADNESEAMDAWNVRAGDSSRQPGGATPCG